MLNIGAGLSLFEAHCPKRYFILTFCLDKVRHIKSLAHPQYHCPILKVKCITVKRDEKMRMRMKIRSVWTYPSNIYSNGKFLP